jgi:nitrate/nitrite-specific signal transduction histidine kinase
MPEEGLETQDLKDQIEQAAEAIEGHGAPRWTLALSLSTAMLAVFAAIASLLSGSNSNEAILAKNEAVLHQAQASDQWTYYQAKGVKANLAELRAELDARADPPAGEKARGEAERYRREQADIEKVAHGLEEKVEASNRQADEDLERHHRFAFAVTFFQIAIALCAIAALVRQRFLWLVGLAGGCGGLVFLALGLLSK